MRTSKVENARQIARLRLVANGSPWTHSIVPYGQPRRALLGDVTSVDFIKHLNIGLPYRVRAAAELAPIAGQGTHAVLAAASAGAASAPRQHFRDELGQIARAGLAQDTGTMEFDCAMTDAELPRGLLARGALDDIGE